MNAFAELLELKQASALTFQTDDSRLALYPDLGGRVFAEVGDLSVHRIDLDTVAHPDRPFNNYGGGNLWPAPEGGIFGFNYRGNEWFVQPAINNQPFEVKQCDNAGAMIRKQVTLTNRKGTRLEAIIRRRVRLAAPLAGLDIGSCRACLCYQTEDTFEVLNTVATEDALIAAWTLDQFEASPQTISFGAVRNPREAINFDYYAHPGRRIAYYDTGFTYQTDGHCRGQIGIRKDSHPAWIGCHDLARNLLCLRVNQGPMNGVYFNMADNDQPQGPYSAADCYSIFNSDSDMKAFELEAIGGARVENGLLKGSVLVSLTLLAVVETPDDLDRFLARHLGSSA